MEAEQTIGERKRKRSIGIAMMTLLGLLALFTLFSNTLQSLTLPKVKTEKVVPGQITFKIEGGGMLQPIAEAKLSSPEGLVVQRIHVKEGDRVKKGQELITYDSGAAERELEDEIMNLHKQKLELQEMQDQFIQSMREEDEFASRKIKRNIESMQLDLVRQQRKMDEASERLEKLRHLIAPFDGWVMEVNAAEDVASTVLPEIRVSNSSEGYRLDLNVDSTILSSLELLKGEAIEVEVQSADEQQMRVMEGTVIEIGSTGLAGSVSQGADAEVAEGVSQRLLRIEVMDAELRGGEQAWIRLEKRSRHEGWLVSNAAIHRDREGMYVYKIEEQRGALGNIFVARKVRISFSERNDRETMIQSDSLYPDESIILESGEPLEDGNRIRLQ